MADDNDLDILAWTMLGEAAGEGTQGMADVGHVILNRLNNGGYGSSISQVAQANKQFSTWNAGAGGNDPKGRYPKSSQEFQRARQLAEQVVAGTIQGPPGRPLDYHAPSVSPYWANSKDRNGTYTRNGHVFYPTLPVPKGEVPNAVGSLNDTVPRIAPAPATPSIDMAQMRRISAPSQLIPDTFAGLSRAKRNLGDEIGMSPILGGKQQAPLFDAGYDTRTGNMRLFSNGPADTQGVYTAASRPPAPIPAMPSPQLAARRATDPVLQTALNTRYPAQLPPMPPSTRSVATTTIRPSASDRVRGNPMQTREQATLVASIPTRPQVSASDLARGRSGISTVASIPTTGFPTTAQILAGTGFRGGSPPAVPDRLMASSPYPPALYGEGVVAGIGGNAVAPVPAIRPAQFSPPVQPTAIGGRPIAPVPFMRPTSFGGAPRIAPVPFMRPAQRPIVPMPPMPIARPGTGGPFRIAPMPMPANMRPASRPTASRPPLRITVNGGSGSGSGSGSRPTPQGYTDTGNGRLVSDETGGVYFTRHL